MDDSHQFGQVDGVQLCGEMIEVKAQSMSLFSDSPSLVYYNKIRINCLQDPIVPVQFVHSFSSEATNLYTKNLSQESYRTLEIVRRHCAEKLLSMDLVSGLQVGLTALRASAAFW